MNQIHGREWKRDRMLPVSHDARRAKCIKYICSTRIKYMGIPVPVRHEHHR